MQTSHNVVYVGVFQFPHLDASAWQVRGIGLSLREAGFSVAFAGMERRGQPEDLQPDGGYCFQGFRYYPEKDFGNTRLSRLKRAVFTHASGNTTIQRLRAMDLTATRAVIAYNAPAILLWRLKSFCRRRNLALIAQSTEWYDPTHLPGGALGPFRWDSELRMQCLQPRIGRILTSSSYLERYYLDHGCAVIRVPPTLDMQDPFLKQRDPGPRDIAALHLVYAGIPGKKDQIGNALRGMRILRAQGLSVVMDLVGPSREQVVECLEGDGTLLNELGEAVVYHGRVPHRTALELVVKADFSILLRPDQRFAHAGFSGKLVESLSLGVPIIANPTSDIAEYVSDGKEGILLENNTPEAFISGVRRLFRMPREQWSEMRSHARRRAADCFDYRQYIQPLKAFMEQAIASSESERRS